MTIDEAAAIIANDADFNRRFLAERDVPKAAQLIVEYCDPLFQQRLSYLEYGLICDKVITMLKAGPQ